MCEPSHVIVGNRVDFARSHIHGAFKDEKCLVFPADFKMSLLFEEDKSRLRVMCDVRYVTFDVYV